MSALPQPTPIREFSNVDRRMFAEEIRPLGQPAVLRGLAADWPAVEAGRRSAESLVAYLGGFPAPRPVTAIVGPPEIEGRFFYRDDLLRLNFERGTAALDLVLQRLLREVPVEKPHAIAVQSEPVPEILPGFREQNDIDLIDPAIVPRAWIGNAIEVATHYDLKENIGCVVAGRRRFTVFPPDQVNNLYVGPFELTPAGTPISLVHLSAPDLDRFPRFAEAMAVAQSALLEPGDAIYLPFHWWHAVESLEPMNMFVNYWWTEAMEGLGNPYDALMHALYALRHLPPEQREVWRGAFDHYVFCANGDPAEHLPAAARGILGPATPQQLQRMRGTLQATFDQRAHRRS
jgi:hypothetical protein